MALPGSKAYLKRFVKSSKSEPLIDEVEVVQLNPKYANIRNSSGRELTVSLKDLVPYSSRALQLPSMLASLLDKQATAELNENLVFYSELLANSVPTTVKVFKMFYVGVLQVPINGFLLLDLTLMNEIVVNQGCSYVCSLFDLCFLIM